MNDAVRKNYEPKYIWLAQIFPPASDFPDAPKRVMVWAEIEAESVPELCKKVKEDYPTSTLGAFLPCQIYRNL